MLTAPYLACSSLGLRPDFVPPREGSSFPDVFDPCLGALDAPDVIAAGSHVSVPSLTDPSWSYGVPSSVPRVPTRA